MPKPSLSQPIDSHMPASSKRQTFCSIVLGFSLGVSALSSVMPTTAYALGGEALLGTDPATDALLTASGIADDSENSESSSTAESDSTAKLETATEDDAEDSTPVVSNSNITEKTTAIDTTPNVSNDSDIRTRILGIFSEIEGLNKVAVRVNQGVVTLTGDVPNEKKALQAVHLADRINDVVAVNDSIARTLDVQDNVTPVLSGLEQKMRGLIQAAPLLLVAILVFSFVAWFGGWLSRRTSLWTHITPNPFVADLVAQSIKVLFVVIGLILALSLLGAEAIIGTLLGSAGVIGIAVGFAVKDTIENYIASILLSMRQPFRARDHVKINDYDGIVVRLTSRATVLMTLDGNRLRIPNSEVFKGIILNYTKTPERRFEFQLGVDSNDDPMAAIKVGLDAINAQDFILTDPKAVGLIDDVGDSNIALTFQAWVDQSKTDFSKARSLSIREAKHALENTGFSLPEPIYKVRFKGGVEKALEHLPGSSASRVTENASTIDDTVASMTVTPTTQGDDSLAMPSTQDVTSLADSVDSVSDEKAKIEAKERAKQVLGNSDTNDVFDATPDPKMRQKVDEEIQDSTGDTDLLSHNSPEE